MKPRVKICSVLVLAITMVATSLSFAECPEGLTEVTIIKGHSGQSMSICINPSAIQHIGGVNDIVIPAACPCDMTLLSYIDWYGERYGDPQTEGLHCEAWDESDIQDALQLSNKLLAYWGSSEAEWRMPRTACRIYGADIDGQTIHDYKTDLTAEELRACAAQIWAFAVYELGLECTGVYPDFEP